MHIGGVQFFPNRPPVTPDRGHFRPPNRGRDGDDEYVMMTRALLGVVMTTFGDTITYFW